MDNGVQGGPTGGDSPKLKVSELARIAGVSASTVSKVINGRPGISDETRRQVERVLHKHGYSRPLVSTKISPTIELVVEYIAHNGTMELIKYASYWAQQAGLAVTVTQTSNGVASEECFRGIIDRNPQGVIMQQMGGLNDLAKSLLRARDIPIVVIDPIDAVDTDVMSVAIDNWTAGYQAGRHLLSLGHRRIGAIRGPLDLQTGIARYSGFAAALAQEGVPLPERYVRQGDYFPAETSYRAACELIELGDDRPSAIFCCNDLSAVSAYRAAREHGLHLPDDLSVMGFDDIFPAEHLMPSLTSIHQPFSEIAQRAVQMIVDVREGHDTEHHVILPTRVVARESTVPPRA
ncbi:LacI family DNA-binding transcriptional regulator [Bifidobacterium sp. MA2]|uniref:LacI family DNA-binding transcriptional regulator n=1 Tax=Bifidobacterium santillanense TaxID=2809028 RepID=A0ABS5URU7_9BIFI|nr:LacI family DNA-binding transcriptional regulator [Bifidobacterium santillanense]MBT1173627.1 LacI family DNA-binding transcriptional regulator [Bifidobacterium santillanense]